MRRYFIGIVVVLPVIVWVWIASCMSLPNYRAYLVDRLRILGIRSEPLSAPPGTTVTLTALVANPHGVPIGYAWGTCLKGGGLGCTGTTDLNIFGEGLGPPQAANFTFPALGAGMMVVGLFVTDLTGAEKYEIGFKRVFITDTSTIVTNPQIQAHYVGGQPCTTTVCPAGRSVTLTVTGAFGSGEAIPDIPRRLFVSWFVTAGQLTDEITVGEESMTTWTNTEPDGTKVTETTLWAVLRDGSGGIDWTTTTLVVP